MTHSRVGYLFQCHFLLTMRTTMSHFSLTKVLGKNIPMITACKTSSTFKQTKHTQTTLFPCPQHPMLRHLFTPGSLMLFCCCLLSPPDCLTLCCPCLLHPPPFMLFTCNHLLLFLSLNLPLPSLLISLLFQAFLLALPPLLLPLLLQAFLLEPCHTVPLQVVG